MKRIESVSPEEWRKALESEALLDYFVSRIQESHSSWSFDELKSFGWEGMLYAVQNHDPEKGSFSTFAWFAVQSSIIDGIEESGETVRGSVLSEDGEVHRTRERREFLGLDIDITTSPISPNIGHIGNSLVDEITSDENHPAHDRTLVATDEESKIVDRVALQQALDSLNDLEKRIIDEYYFKGSTEREIATQLGYSQQYINSILQRALKKLRVLLEDNDEVAT